jgi:hypothetical protein
MRREKRMGDAVITSLTIILLLSLVAVSLLTCFRFVDVNSTILLAIFDLFFLALFFQLNGTSTLKVGLLATGTILGLVWNAIFHQLSLSAFVQFGVSANTVFTVIYPLLNLMWIVPFCSLSLSLLPRFEVHSVGEAET